MFMKIGDAELLEVAEGEVDAELQVTMDSPVFFAIIEKTESPMAAYSAGKLKTNALEYEALQRIPDASATDLPGAVPETQPESNIPDIPLPQKSSPAPDGQDDKGDAPDGPKKPDDPKQPDAPEEDVRRFPHAPGPLRASTARQMYVCCRIEAEQLPGRRRGDA